MLEHPAPILYPVAKKGIVMLGHPAPILYPVAKKGIVMLGHPAPILYLVVKKGSNVGASSHDSLPSGKEG